MQFHHVEKHSVTPLGVLGQLRYYDISNFSCFPLSCASKVGPALSLFLACVSSDHYLTFSMSSFYLLSTGSDLLPPLSFLSPTSIFSFLIIFYFHPMVPPLHISAQLIMSSSSPFPLFYTPSSLGLFPNLQFLCRPPISLIKSRSLMLQNTIFIVHTFIFKATQRDFCHFQK